MKHFTLNHYFSKTFLIIVAISFVSFYADAQTKPATTAPATTAKTTSAVKVVPAGRGAVALVDTFFKKYKDDGTNPAIDYLFGTNKLFTNTSQITLLKAKLDSLRQSIGAYLGKELIVQKSASPSLVFYSYLVKYENQPLRFTFMFYKAKNDWVLYRFKYDDQMDNELEDAGKINMKRP